MARSTSSWRATLTSPTRVIRSPARTPAASAGLRWCTASTTLPLTTSPCHVCSSLSTDISRETTSSTRSIGMANPMPCAPARTATLMPITSPLMLSSGPPLLPGLMLASVWIRSPYRCVRLTSTLRCRAEMMPRVTVCS